jgi:hypothetical protein
VKPRSRGDYGPLLRRESLAFHCLQEHSLTLAHRGVASPGAAVAVGTLSRGLGHLDVTFRGWSVAGVYEDRRAHPRVDASQLNRAF